MAPAEDAWDLLTHGFQFSSMVQAYSALPFNITSGVTTIQGTAGRPIVDGEFIPRNAGVGSDFFSASLRVSRAFRVTSRVRLEGLAEVFNLTNRTNDLTRNTNFGAGSVSDKPAADVQSDHGRGRSAIVAVCGESAFLMAGGYGVDGENGDSTRRLEDPKTTRRRANTHERVRRLHRALRGGVASIGRGREHFSNPTSAHVPSRSTQPLRRPWPACKRPRNLLRASSKLRVFVLNLGALRRRVQP